MGISDILIIASCLGAGYWIVSRLMGSGNDVTDADRDSKGNRETRGKPTHADSGTGPQAVPDWHIVLDIPRDASLREIEAARKRRLAAAAHMDDTALAVRIQQAADWAMRTKR